MSLTAKPFLKWVGGKTQLLNEIRQYYPFLNGNITKYAEPFVGGGAVLFDVINNYGDNLQSIYISDINEPLINTYTQIRDNCKELVAELESLRDHYTNCTPDAQKQTYLANRQRYNTLISENIFSAETAALLIFLNKTCFNGLYRVNSKGQFNVPIGSYKNPLICDHDNLLAVSSALQKVIIVNADYRESKDFIDSQTFVYLDPPYRPLNKTSSFTSYTKELFGDKEQVELANFVNDISKSGAKLLVSNSDPKNTDENDNFFDELYGQQLIERVKANRMINSKASRRGAITELLISNFTDTNKMQTQGY